MADRRGVLWRLLLRGLGLLMTTRTDTPTQTERIVAFIRAHPGCSTMELTLGLAPFCANPRARISDARAAGYDVVCETRSDGRKGIGSGSWLL